MMSFTIGLIIGGLLVWVLGASGPEAKETKLPVENEIKQSEVVDNDVPNEEPTDTPTDDASSSIDTGTITTDEPGEVAGPVFEVPEEGGSISVSDQAAGEVVMIGDTVYPTTEGWIAVRDYLETGELGYVLGAARFSTEQALLPKEVVLLRATTAGETYAVVFYNDNGDRKFSLSDDTMIEGQVSSFVAGG